MKIDFHSSDCVLPYKLSPSKLGVVKAEHSLRVGLGGTHLRKTINLFLETKWEELQDNSCLLSQNILVEKS